VNVSTPGVVERLELAAAACGAMGSRLYAAMFRSAVLDYEAGGPVRAFFDLDPSRGELSSIGIRLMGALHYCALDRSAPDIAAHFPSCGGDGDAGAAWRAAAAFLAAEPTRVATLFDRTPQTNEVARATPLLGGALAIAAETSLPMRLLDVGASAGLNTRLDRFRYEGTGWSWGDPATSLTLRNRTRSGVPKHLDAPLHILVRAACDLHPLDTAREEDRLELRSFVWADQLDRFQRLNDAIEAVSRVPLAVEAADAFDWIPRRATPFDGTVTVIMHSIVTEHLTPELRRRWNDTIVAAGTAARPAAPMAWLRLEPSKERYELRVTQWPSGEERVVARCDGHGQDIEWVETE
jgi:hypothetical protein